MRFVDLTGKVFGQLTVLRRVPSTNNQPKWECQCACGNHTEVFRGNLQRGYTVSCGCIMRQRALENSITHGEARKPASREYAAWSHAKQRCYDAKCKNYPGYGGRGIRMCEEWKNSYETFLLDMGRCPPKHQLDRRDNDGPYAPHNCRWVTSKVNNNNRRDNHRITAFGQTKTLAQWADSSGLQDRAITRRLDWGWPAERALTQPIRR
jgi:hypothetical protein